jgi:hypothetical protein
MIYPDLIKHSAKFFKGFLMPNLSIVYYNDLITFVRPPRSPFGELVWLATTLNLRANRLLHTHRLCMARQCFLGQAQAERIGLCQMSIQ